MTRREEAREYVGAPRVESKTVTDEVVEEESLNLVN